MLKMEKSKRINKYIIITHDTANEGKDQKTKRRITEQREDQFYMICGQGFYKKGNIVV